MKTNKIATFALIGAMATGLGTTAFANTSDAELMKDVKAFEQELANISETELEAAIAKQNAELEKEAAAYFAKFDKVISEKDWNTLSMKDIDAKLKAAGVEALGDTKDPLYDKTPAEIEALSDAEWKKIDAQYAQETVEITAEEEAEMKKLFGEDK